jgi:hypothetical protein
MLTRLVISLPNLLGNILLLLRLAASGVLTTGMARIWAKTDAGVVRARVTLLLPEISAFN